MTKYLNLMQVEFIKLLTHKIVWIIAVIVCLIQPLLAMINAKDILRLGLDASPLTHPELAQALPSVEYLGIYDVLPFGLLPMIVLGGILGASEYRNHQLRRTFLYANRRVQLFLVKISCLGICVLILSFVSIYLTTVVTHFYLGDLGLNPVVLSVITWKFIGYSLVEWTLLTLLSYLIASVCQTALVSFLFLIPQVYLLAFEGSSQSGWREYLPIVAGKFLSATPVDMVKHAPVKGSLLLLAWLLILWSIGLIAFCRKEVGGKF
ncbi:hypothetical protein IGI37_002586 [Enterococcus sp. AZ194]|uniref:ABC transporter permease n=1 Tax=Enterococcus sp. AZ194 TaxID=2774629 RepID=UPI003F224FEA